jgi:hypothetical protein
MEHKSIDIIFFTFFRIILDIHIVHFIYTTFIILLFKFNICYIIVINVILLKYLKTNDEFLIFFMKFYVLFLGL